MLWQVLISYSYLFLFFVVRFPLKCGVLMNIACRVEFFYTAAACVAAVLYAAVSIFDFVFLPVPQAKSFHCLVVQQNFGCEFALLAR